MATAALRELQVAFLPAAIGTVGVIYSNILGWGVMGKVRYVEAGKQVHPYKPWEDKSDTADAHFRAFKACQNGVEWTTFTVPLLFLFNLYTPSIPYIGAYAPLAAAVLGLAFGYYNVQYIEGALKPSLRSVHCELTDCHLCRRSRRLLVPAATLGGRYV